MAIISLLAWAKKTNVSYGYAQKLMQEGAIPVSRSPSGKRILISDDVRPPERQKVSCAICGQLFPQITGTHLSLHELTVDEYKIRFPNDKMISDDIIESIKSAVSGNDRTQEHKDNLSAALQGRTAWNKGMSGVHKVSDETRNRMSIAHKKMEKRE